MLHRIDPQRWEHGSEFHWIHGLQPTLDPSPWDRDNVMCGSGRDALRLLLDFGIRVHGWKRIWFPCYFCQEVLQSVISTGIITQLYEGGPEQSILDIDLALLKDGDVLFIMNYFGLHEIISEISFPIPIIEDHSHDPWSDWAFHSRADWCIASLRKTLPIPDGGVLWSPVGESLPISPCVSSTREEASIRKLSAMTLKGMYLEGHEISKEAFRDLSICGESRIASGVISGMPNWTREMLSTFPFCDWRKKRLANYKVLLEALENFPGLSVLKAYNLETCCPFVLSVKFRSLTIRDSARRALTEQRVYTAIHWPMTEPIIRNLPRWCLDMSEKVLSIHCDARYDAEDMLQVAKIIKKLPKKGCVFDQ